MPEDFWKVQGFRPHRLAELTLYWTDRQGKNYCQNPIPRELRLKYDNVTKDKTRNGGFLLPGQCSCMPEGTVQDREYV